MAKSDSRKAALQREEDLIRSMLPEAEDVRKGREDYLGRRRAAIARVAARPGEIPKLPSVTDAERAGASRSQEILEVQKMKQKVLDNIQAYRESDNPLERMKLARDIIKNHQSAKATVISASLGAKGKVLAQKMASRDKKADQIIKIDQQYSMNYAQPKTHTKLKEFRDSIDNTYGDASIIPDETNAQFMIQNADEVLAGIDDPTEKARLLSALDGELVKKGFKPVTTFIQEGRARKAEGDLPVGEMALNSLVNQTAGFDERTFGSAARANQLQLEHDKMDQEIQRDNKRLGGSPGTVGSVLTTYRALNKEMGVAGSETDEAALKPFTDQLAQLDDMITTLKRPSFTDEYQRSRAQMLAHPMFDDYMKMRGFMAGQEDAALKQLVQEAEPMVRKQVAISKLAARIDPDDPRTAVGKVTSKLPIFSKIGMTKKRKEAVKRAAELDPAAAGEEESRAETFAELGIEGPSQFTRGKDLREEADLDRDKTIFQMEGLTPTTGPVDKQMSNPAGGPIAQTDSSDDKENAGQALVDAGTKTAASLAGGVPAVDSVDGELASVSRLTSGRQRRTQALRDLGPTFG